MVEELIEEDEDDDLNHIEIVFDEQQSGTENEIITIRNEPK